jgi:hypothetical protein
MKDLVRWDGLGGWRPAGAKRVTVPYADTALLMPTNMRTAAAEHRVGRGNGAVLVTGVRMAQQLEKATTNNYRTEALWFGNHDNPCHNRVLKLAPPHRLPQVRSLLRLRRAAGRPGRNRRLRAQTETRSQMPISRPVNSRSIQSSRNTTNSGIDRFDSQRTFLRRTAHEVRNKKAILCPDGTRHRCPLGSITSFAPREATVTQRRLRIPDFSSPVRGLPLKKKQTKHSSAIWTGWERDFWTSCLQDSR